MKEVVREHSRKSNMQSLSLSAYSHQQDHNVPFNLCIAAADFGEVEEKILLEIIVALCLWVAICGFSFVSGWIEQYKQTNKKKKTCKSLRL